MCSLNSNFSFSPSKPTMVMSSTILLFVTICHRMVLLYASPVRTHLLRTGRRSASSERSTTAFAVCSSMLACLTNSRSRLYPPPLTPSIDGHVRPAALPPRSSFFSAHLHPTTTYADLAACAFQTSLPLPHTNSVHGLHRAPCSAILPITEVTDALTSRPVVLSLPGTLSSTNPNFPFVLSVLPLHRQ